MKWKFNVSVSLNPQYTFFFICGLVLNFEISFSWCSDYSKKHIQEIYEDVNAFGLKSSNPNVVTNSHLAIAWLEATFPDLLHQSTDTSFLMSKAHAYAPVDDSLTLQVWFHYASITDIVRYNLLSLLYFCPAFGRFKWSALGCHCRGMAIGHFSLP